LIANNFIYNQILLMGIVHQLLQNLGRSVINLSVKLQA